MKNLKINTAPKTKAKFAAYPKKILPKLVALRALILDVAMANETITELEETLKWGEPSYLVKNGSTIRIDWKTKTPDQYAMYFKCTSKLVTTFRAVFGDTFTYEKNRAILFQLDEKVPKKELKECIAMALNYHQVKNLPRLGH